MSKKNHVHKYKRKKYKNGEEIYFCVKDDCSFKINTDLSLGKTCECWRCGQPFSMTVLSKRMDKPHCADCTKSRNKSKVNVAIDFGSKPSFSVDNINKGASKPDDINDLRARLRGSIERTIKESSIANDEGIIEDEDNML